MIKIVFENEKRILDALRALDASRLSADVRSLDRDVQPGSRYVVQGGRAGGRGRSQAAPTPSRLDEDEELTELRSEPPRRWIHLPSRIRWGRTPRARLSQAGTWYLRVPLRGRGGGPPEVRTITPTSRGWIVPERPRAAQTVSRAAPVVQRVLQPVAPSAMAGLALRPPTASDPAPPGRVERATPAQAVPSPPVLARWTERVRARVSHFFAGFFTRLQ